MKRIIYLLSTTSLVLSALSENFNVTSNLDNCLNQGSQALSALQDFNFELEFNIMKTGGYQTTI